MGTNDRNTIKRKDKVYTKLKELTESLHLKGPDNPPSIGFDAEYIGNKIGVSRANASKELNRLLEEGKILKIKGKPVLYLDKQFLESQLEHSFKNIYSSSEEFKTFLGNLTNLNPVKSISNDKKGTDFSTGAISPSPDNKKTEQATSFGSKPNTYDANSSNVTFNHIIGVDKSLKAQVELAKAAILYPPNGIHTLIVGPTGVGKSTFAEAMYKYAKHTGRFSDKSSFVIFNCADYSDNPQLLISQLFGHSKGAFTGADKEKEGLIDRADGGVLFLDEVHRLPAEGQEMLFILMDKGIYRRLGETDSKRHAKVLIIAATTEEPKSTLLHTFLRRIPAMIELPSLDKRTLEERAELITQFFLEESSRINVPIKVSKEVLRAFMYYNCSANLGQLRSDIKLICAKAFLDYLSLKTAIMEVKLSHLSQNVQEGLFRARDTRRPLVQSQGITFNKDIVFDSSKDKDFKNFIIEPPDKMHYTKDYYGTIIDNWQEYAKNGLSKKEIRDRIEADLEEYFHKQLTVNTVNNEIISNIVGSNVLAAVEYALNSIKDIFGELINERVICGLALHINNLIERLRSGNVISHPNKELIAKDYPVEYSAAQKIKWVLEERLSMLIPDDEAAFIAMLLYAIKTTKYRENIGILVIAHGKTTASSMADVANKLLGVEHARAIDMPLEESVNTILNKAIEEVKNLDRGKGVLLLVDMGSLITFSNFITEKTGIKTRHVDMVNTPMVIEATRKAIMPNIDLEQLVEDVKTAICLLDRKDENIRHINQMEDQENYFKTNLINTLEKTLTFLNPQKVYHTLYLTLDGITNQLNKELDNDILVKFLFHCSCMVERVIKDEPLFYRNLDRIRAERGKILAILKQVFENVEDTFGISIPDSELAYVLEMIDTHFNTHTKIN
ncbi:MAG: sigma-54-dependent transcriptional regulator [Bacillota bacterium]